MKLLSRLAFFAIFASAITAFAQSSPPSAGGPSMYMVHHFSNLNSADSYIDLTNDGSFVTSVASGMVSFGQDAAPGATSQTQNICANVYAFDANEEIVSCCTCPITANGLKSLSVKNDLASNTLTPGVPLALVVKLIATTPVVAFSSSGSAAITNGCDATAAPYPFTAFTGSGNYTFAAFSLHAWGVTPHLNTSAGAYGLTETEFSQASLSSPELTADNEFSVGTLSSAELNNITTACYFINTVGSGYGICKSCQVRGLGAAQQ
jgi:hypothetical protein